MATGEILAQVADQRTVEEIKTAIGETDDTGGSTVAGTTMAKMNKAIEDIEMQKNKLDTVLTILGSGVAEFATAGKHQVKIPAGITKLKITACGGGGGGACGGCQSERDEDFPSGTVKIPSGGSGGVAIVNKEFTIPNTGVETLIDITVGNAGRGSTNPSNPGKNGEATVIGNLVTLQGGIGGKVKLVNISSKTPIVGDITPSAGEGSGSGAAGVVVATGRDTTLVNFSTQKGDDGINSATGGNAGTGKVSKEKTKYLLYLGGPGGGSLGKGGNSGKLIFDDTGESTSFSRSTKGTKGGGGAGSTGYGYYGSLAVDKEDGLDGGVGYVRIEWGL